MTLMLGKRYFSCTAAITEGGMWHFHIEETKGKDGEDVKREYRRIKWLGVITVCFISWKATATLLIFAAHKKEVLPWLTLGLAAAQWSRHRSLLQG